MLGLPEWLGTQHFLHNYLAPVFKASSQIMIKNNLPLSEELLLIIISVLGVLIAIICSWFIYIKRYKGTETKTPAIFRIFEAKYWMDEIYEFLFVKPVLWLSDTFYRIIELKWIDGLVNNIGVMVVRTGNWIKYIQNGYIEFYVYMMVLGIIALFIINIIIR